MRTLKGEVMINVPAPTAWGMFMNNEVVSKINPQFLAEAEYLQGDGSPGSLRHFKLGPALRGFVKESTQKIEKVENGRLVSYSLVDGELRNMYDPYKITFTFMPEPGYEQKKCKAEWKADFEPLNPDVPPPEKAREAALDFLRSLEKFHCSV
ncbi:major strawberry allergen Fra a 1-E-like [Nymphaea colorata]|nr:major strawberry allergen Fra a 1-E-like [Nymphaea colorata]